MGQIKFKIDTTFSDQISAGMAAKYLNSKEILLRDGIEIAISCLFAPISAAVEGAPLSEVEEQCKKSRTQFEIYMNLALSRVRASDLSQETFNEIDITETTEAILSEESNSGEAEKAFFVSNDEEEIDEDDVYINFEGEEF